MVTMNHFSIHSIISGGAEQTPRHRKQTQAKCSVQDEPVPEAAQVHLTLTFTRDGDIMVVAAGAADGRMVNSQKKIWKQFWFGVDRKKEHE